MSSLKFYRLWLGLGLAGVFAVIVLSLISLPSIPLHISYADKIEHIIAYAVMMYWFCQLYESVSRRLLLAVLFVLMGIGLEFLQGMGTVRQFEVLDMVADTLGVILAGMIATLFRFRPLARLDHLLVRYRR